MLSARPKNYVRYCVALLCAAVNAISLSVPANAGVFNVRPIRLFIQKDTSSVILTLQNQDTQPLRVQIAGVRWTNDRSGQPQLTPTDDLIVFPTLLTMNPLETRNIRIGFSGTPPRDTELSYRITIDELPSLESQIDKPHSAGLVVRTRLTVPVFFEPDATVKKAEINQVSVQRGVAHALFTNKGNFHLVVGDVDVTGRNASGSRIFSTTIKGWYVLAGETREFLAQLPRNQCKSLKALSFTVHSDVGVFSRTAPVTAGECT